MRKLIAFLIVTIMGLTLSGCATLHPESAAEKKVALDNSPTYPIVLVPTSVVTVSQARAYQDGGEFVVFGRVKRRHKVQLPGRVALEICARDGTLLVQETVRVAGLSSKRKGVLELPFRFRIARTLPMGATIHLQYRAPAAADSKVVCSKV